jgi:tetratricopeptide (TPR) repeat protein
LRKIVIVFLISVFFGCSTQKNKTLNKSYHSVVSTYNVLFNGNEYLNKGLENFNSSYEENYWDILPIEPIESTDKIITVDGLENQDFLKAEEKAAKAIQKHSMLINEIQYNSKISEAYFLLGKARYFDQRYLPAIDAFNQIYKLNKEDDFWAKGIIWKSKSHIRLNQESVAVDLINELLEEEDLDSEIVSNANGVLAMAFLNLEENDKAVKPLKNAIKTTKQKSRQARYLYVLGQLYESKKFVDSAKINFTKVVNFKRRVPRDLYVNAKTKKLQFSKNIDLKKEFLKMIENEENKPYLDKIYYSYSQALLNSDSLQLAKKYLKSSVRENSTDKDLKSKVYINLFELNFNASEYLLAGKYLDSALNVIDKKSREFWTLDRQKKGIEKVVNIEANLLLWDSLLKISNYDKEKLNKVLNDVLDSRTLTNTGTRELQPPTTKNSSQTFIKTNFYFYNPQIVSLGKQSFITLWGNRNRDTYWRSIQSNSAKSEGKNIKTPKMEILEKSVDYTEIYKEIPFTKFEKDSIHKLIELSKLELAESYIVKYGNHKLGQSIIKNFFESNSRSNLLTNAKYLLYKSYKIQNDRKYVDIKEDILMNDSLSRFAKILSKDPKFILDQKTSIVLLDSLKILFQNQKFEEVINSAKESIGFVENEDILIDLEILLANSFGRLEGVNKYNEVLKEISKKYPTSAKSKQLIKISNKINRKWKEPNKLTKSDDFKIVFVLSKMDFSDNQIKESLRLIEKTIDVKKRVSYDVYDYDRALIVIHDYTNRDDAENDIFKLKQELEGFQLKNNFVSLSSQYKNMLIYKTLELE